MPTPINPRGEDNPSTYFVQDKNSEAEMIRLMIQDSLITAGMGGPLVEQPDPSRLHRVLDIGCGPGGWILETAALYPHMELVGIDISWKMIEYARAQAKAQRLTDGVEFHVMDALRSLEFPNASFDLVTIRLGTSFMPAKDWPQLLREMARVARPGGVLRVIDCDAPQSNSPAYTRLNELLTIAVGRAGRSYKQGGFGMLPLLPRLLSEAGCQNVQTRACTLEYLAGTVAGQNFQQNIVYFCQTVLPFLEHWNCAPDDYETLQQQALVETQQKDFRATWYMETIWGTLPR